MNDLMAAGIVMGLNDRYCSRFLDIRIPFLATHHVLIISFYL